MTTRFKYVDLLFRSQSGKKNKPKGAINQIDREKKSSIKKAWTTANVEDTTTFCNEFSKTLEYLYFSDPWDEKELVLILILLFGISTNRLLYQLTITRTHCLHFC